MSEPPHDFGASDNRGGPPKERNGSTLRASRVMTIFTKEFREVFRDRRTIISVIVSPLLVTPILFLLLGVVAGTETRKEKLRIYDVGVVGRANAPELAAAVGGISQLHTRDVSKEEAESEIAAKRLAAVVILPQDASKLSADYTPIPVVVLLDAGNESSQAAAMRLSGGLNKIGDRIVTSRLADKHLSSAFATPFNITETPIKGGGNVGSILLATMLPYLLVVSSFGGSIYASFDQVAGEKERGTLETLLVSPASRREIVVGKFCAVAAVCVISSILSVIGVIISFALPGTALALISKGGLHLSPAAVGISVLVMLPLAVLFAGMLIAVSTFARNQKEAQTYIAPILIAVMVPVLVSVFVRGDVPRYMSIVPVLGTSIIIKQAFGSTYDPIFIFMAFGSSIVYGALALLLATRLFEIEDVLTKS